MKLRISRELHERAKCCADLVGDSLGRWCGLALKAWRSGKLGGVAVDEFLLDATREGSTVVTVDGYVPATTYRRAIAAAVVWCEARNPKPVVIGLVEGRDYLVNREGGVA